MKRLIPVVVLLAVAVAAGVYFYPRLTKKGRARQRDYAFRQH